MEKISLLAGTRNLTGKKTKKLRKQDIIPAVVYGRGFDSISVQVGAKDFEKVYTEAGESTIVYLKTDGGEYPVIIKEIVRDPVRDSLLHVDFYKVRLDEKINAGIKLNFTGESPAVKELGGILVKNLSEIEVEGLPQDLPHQIEVDISLLKNLGDHILIKNLPISDKLKVHEDAEAIVVLVQEPISEEELQAQFEAPATPEDVEIIKKEKEEEDEGGIEEKELPAAEK